MKELKNAVRKLVAEEYLRASERYGGRFSSPHEAYAVILEEEEEARDEIAEMKLWMRKLWDAVKHNYGTRQDEILELIEEYALSGACECIQVAAMAQKARK